MESKLKMAVLGAGNAGYALASDLALEGFEVNLFELDRFKEHNLMSIQEKGGIEREGFRPGFIKLSMLTTDIEEALNDVDVINITVPAFAHMEFIELIAPYLDDKIVVFFPLNFADVKLRRYLKEKDMEPDVVVGGGETIPYACRRMRKPAYIFVRNSPIILRVAALPAKDTCKLIEILKKYPLPIVPVKTTLEVSLAYHNPIGHISTMLLNAASIERTKGRWEIFYTVDDPERGLGIQPSQIKLNNKIIEERNAICKRLGIDLESRGIGLEARSPEGKRQTYIPHSPETYWHLTNTLNHRYFNEDIPYGLVTWSSFGDVLGVPTPTMKSCIQIASVLLETDFWKEGLTIEKLGLAELKVKDILKYFLDVQL